MKLAKPVQEFLELPDAERRLGPYVLRRPLGRGGFAPVWLADETYFGVTIREVAVKVFAVPPAGSIDAEARRRAVVDEAQRLSHVRHANVVQLHALAVDEPRNLLGLVMEYLNGESLADRLGARGPLKVDEAIDLGRVLASALASAHAVGVVHRDVKPANVISSRDRWTLIDFGIAAAERSATKPRRSGVRVIGDVPIDLTGLGTIELARFTVGASDTEAFSGTIGYACPHCVAHA